MNSLTAHIAHMLERDLAMVTRTFGGMDLSWNFLMQVADGRNEGNVVAGEVDVVVERTITC